MAGWLGRCLLRRPDLHTGIRVTTILDDRNEVQPDLALWMEKPGGTHVNDDHFLVVPPQIVIEVCASSASYELHSKKEAYRRNKVREYVVWRVLEQAIDWNELRNGDYVLREPGADGIIERSQFPGLRLHVPSLLALDRAGLVAPLHAPA
jgi:Uma2 family endonuclease